MSQSNLVEILKTEHKLLLEAPEKYGDFFHHATESLNLIQSFIASVDQKGWLFIAFLSHIRKHHLLALLSIIRLQHVQASMNLRQVLESGTNAAYALANPKSEDFTRSSPEGLLEIPEELQNKRYKWLENNYPKGSDAIKAMKKMMQSASHSNIIDVHRTFKYQHKNKSVQLVTPFFDSESDFQIKTDLWTVANIAMGLMDLFYGVSLKYPYISFSQTFLERLKNLDKENARLKEIMMGTPKYKRADERAIARDKRKQKLS
jgi:hypothetical protein